MTDRKETSMGASLFMWLIAVLVLILPGAIVLYASYMMTKWLVEYLTEPRPEKDTDNA